MLVQTLVFVGAFFIYSYLLYPLILTLFKKNEFSEQELIKKSKNNFIIVSVFYIPFLIYLIFDNISFIIFCFVGAPIIGFVCAVFFVIMISFFVYSALFLKNIGLNMMRSYCLIKKSTDNEMEN